MALVDKLIQNDKLKKFIYTILERVKLAEIGSSAAAIAYYLLLSIFPLMIAIGNILPFLHINPAEVLNYISEIVPAYIFEMLEGTIHSLLERPNSGLLSVSALATLWAASRSINSLQISLNKVYGVADKTNKIFTRLFSFVAIFAFLMAVVLLAMFFTLGQSILDYLLPLFKLPTSISGIFGTLKWPVTMLSLFFTMSLIYGVLPNVKQRLRFIFPGALFTTIGWMVLSQAFGIYTKYFSTGFNSNTIIGGFVVFMIWLDFAATLIIIGAIINATLGEYFNGEIEQRQRLMKLNLARFANSPAEETTAADQEQE